MPLLSAPSLQRLVAGTPLDVFRILGQRFPVLGLLVLMQVAVVPNGRVARWGQSRRALTSTLAPAAFRKDKSQLALLGLIPRQFRKLALSLSA